MRKIVTQSLRPLRPYGDRAYETETFVEHIGRSIDCAHGDSVS
jgi:hypothetical protein